MLLCEVLILGLGLFLIGLPALFIGLIGLIASISGVVFSLKLCGAPSKDFIRVDALYRGSYGSPMGVKYVLLYNCNGVDYSYNSDTLPKGLCVGNKVTIFCNKLNPNIVKVPNNSVIRNWGLITSCIGLVLSLLVFGFGLYMTIGIIGVGMAIG